MEKLNAENFSIRIEKKDNNSNSIPEIREPVDDEEGRDTSESSN